VLAKYDFSWNILYKYQERKRSGEEVSESENEKVVQSICARAGSA